MRLLLLNRGVDVDDGGRIAPDNLHGKRSAVIRLRCIRLACNDEFERVAGRINGCGSIRSVSSNDCFVIIGGLLTVEERFAPLPEFVHLRDERIVNADEENDSDSQENEEETNRLDIRHRPRCEHGTKSSAQTEEEGLPCQVINIPE